MATGVRPRIGRYEVQGEVGRGGMAVVYLARQLDLDRDVALKELSSFLADDGGFAERFLRESRVAGSLSHPNIVTVHDYFEHEGTPYIAMEFLERGSLRPHAHSLTLAQIAGVLEGLLAGLAHAHSRGVIHRDLKPENLLLTAQGSIKIADFGIAKALNRAQATRFLTVTGTTIGTPTYMSPEQAMGTEVTAPSDLYSAGIIAYEMLVGQVPFAEGQTPMAILFKHVTEGVPSARTLRPELDPRLVEWLEKMLAREPVDRYPTALDAWDDFEEIVIAISGPRWRREARIVEHPSRIDVPEPLTPAPFTGETSIAATTPPEGGATVAPAPTPAAETTPAPTSVPTVRPASRAVAPPAAEPTTPAPEIRPAAPETRAAPPAEPTTPAPEIRPAAPATRAAPPADRVPAPETRVAAPETHVAAPETHVPAPETHVPAPETHVAPPEAPVPAPAAAHVAPAAPVAPSRAVEPPVAAPVVAAPAPARPARPGRRVSARWLIAAVVIVAALVAAAVALLGRGSSTPAAATATTTTTTTPAPPEATPTSADAVDAAVSGSSLVLAAPNGRVVRLGSTLAPAATLSDPASPRALATTGPSTFVADSKTITRLRSDTLAPAAGVQFANALALAPVGSGRVAAVTSDGGGRLCIVTGAKVGPCTTLGFVPTGLGVLGNHLYVSDRTAGTVSDFLVRSSSLTPAGRIKVSGLATGNPVAFGGKLYVPAKRAIAVVPFGAKRESTRIALPATPTSLAVAPSSGRLFAALYSVGKLGVVDTAFTRRPAAVVQTVRRPIAVASSGDGAGGSNVYVVSASTGTVARHDAIDGRRLGEPVTVAALSAAPLTAAAVGPVTFSKRGLDVIARIPVTAGRLDPRNALIVRDARIRDGKARAELWQGGITAKSAGATGFGARVGIAPAAGLVAVNVAAKRGAFTKISTRLDPSGRALVLTLTKPKPKPKPKPPVSAGGTTGGSTTGSSTTTTTGGYTTTTGGSTSGTTGYSSTTGGSTSGTTTGGSTSGTTTGGSTSGTTTGGSTSGTTTGGGTTGSGTTGITVG